MKNTSTVPSHVVRVRAALLLLAAAALLSLGLFQVHRRHQVVRLGYELSEARAELMSLEEEDRRLRLEVSVLTNPARIERLAAALGMRRPGPEQIRSLDTSVAATEAP